MSSTFKPLLLKAANQPDTFTAEDARTCFKAVFESRDVSPAQIGAFLTTLYLNKLERTPRVLGAAATVLRENWVKVNLGVHSGDEKGLVVDIVGTGGDGHNTFNVSTTAAIVAAGAGARVVKVWVEGSQLHCLFSLALARRSGLNFVLRFSRLARILGLQSLPYPINLDSFSFLTRITLSPRNGGPGAHPQVASFSYDPQFARSALKPGRAESDDSRRLIPRSWAGLYRDAQE